MSQNVLPTFLLLIIIIHIQVILMETHFESVVEGHLHFNKS